MDHDQLLRKQLKELLRAGNAHVRFEKVVEDFPLDRIGQRPNGMPHSAWELLEHMRIAQNDILRFSESADYTALQWPEDYWPKSPVPAHKDDWRKSVNSFERDLKTFEKLLDDPSRDLYQAFPWGEGQTLLREALLVADHNAYHLGQLLLVRKALGAWT
jgi:hypothetical protein